jgi:2-phospho-L-lactate/phosphoenolpyruvate guanylyltransferase
MPSVHGAEVLCVFNGCVGPIRTTIIIPVKPPAIGKSRLRGSVSPVNLLDRLVAAIALDTIAAARDAGADVIVVTDAGDIAAEAAAMGAKVRSDTGLGLNAAIRDAEAAIGPGRQRAAMTADLPALRATELREALAEATGAGRSYVSDHHGVGTTLLAAPPGVPLDPRFGGASAHAHAASGAVLLRGDWPGLRLDVDVAADLRQAERLGLGPRARRHIVISESPTTFP